MKSSMTNFTFEIDEEILRNYHEAAIFMSVTCDLTKKLIDEEANNSA